MTGPPAAVTASLMTSQAAPIPVLSLADAPSAAFADALGDSFRRFGFAIVRDHGIADDLIADAWRLSAEFFALPDAVKRRYHVPGGGGQRGYTPFRQEIAKGAKATDLKEFWHVGREATADAPLPEGMAANLWPDEIDGFRDRLTRLFAAFDRTGAVLLSAIATHLGLAPDWFVGPTAQGNSILRLLHYPALTDAGDRSDGAVRAGAHEDINLITLLLGAEEAGLQLLDKSGAWVDIRPPEGAMVINIGDMLQRLTNHVLPSTTHRVVNPPEERHAVSRYSMPFFLHPHPDFRIAALESCVSADNPVRHPPISAQDYLTERLREIGLVKG